MEFHTFILVILLIGSSQSASPSNKTKSVATTKKCEGPTSSNTGIKWENVQAVFDSLDPCTPNPCAKGQVCRVHEETYQHLCEACEAKNTATGKGSKKCAHASSFENLLLMLTSGFYRALPWLRHNHHERFINFSNEITQVPATNPSQNLCNPNPCKNGGKCYLTLDESAYYCICSNQSTGKDCEATEFDERIRIVSGLKASHIASLTKDFPASNAIDNNTDTISHTPVKSIYPWWQVELPALYRIVGLTVVNRKDCCPSRLHDFEVRVGTTSMYSSSMTDPPNSLCYHYPNREIPDGGSLNIYCKPGPIIGRFLSIQIIKSCVPQGWADCATNGDMLTLAEVRLYGHPVH